MLPEEYCATAHKSCACATKKHFGLTLAELLVILLVSSVIMVVLAPVVRKQKSDIGTTSSSSATVGHVLYSYLSPRPECTNSTSDNTLTCTFSAPQGVKFVNIHMVGAGGGGAGATSATTASPTTKTQTSASQLSIPIVAGMQNVTVNNLIGGGGGGGGGTWAETSNGPASQADCDKYDAKYLTASQNGGKAVCVTKYNIGDIPSATNGGIASSVTTVSAGSKCSANSCCWQGNTASPCDSSGTSYSGCNRTVCTWQAANASCLALAYNGTKAGDWRLPTNDELAKWGSNLSTINKNQGDNGLRLCDDSSGYGAARCGGSHVCNVSYDGYCYPDTVWSSTAGGSYYYSYRLNYGTFNGPSNLNARYVFSSRCVYEGGSTAYTSRSGGGGGAAAAMNTTIPESIISDNVGGKIVLYAGAGGTGKSSGTGGEGGTSYVYVYNSSNVLKWGIKAPGGNGGNTASSTTYGTGGAKKASNSCQMYNGTSWVATTCTSLGAAGSNGTTKTGITDSGAATGGRGGSSTYNTSTNGGAGGNSSNENGSTGTAYGAGGGGGTANFQKIDSTPYPVIVPLPGKGGDGKGGIARITYSMSSQAAAGGGGAGASYAFLENVPVTAGRTYTVKVGNGGNGGAVNIDGTDGGVTSVQYDGGTYTINGGKAGKKGTSGSGTSLIQGLGGALGTSNIPSANLKAGAKGSNASYLSDISSGGNGGKSGINTDGGCGGFQTTDCTNVASSGKNSQYVLPVNLHTTARQFGSAGAGGGGGAWKLAPSSDSGPGGGANGQAGYVYIYWIENN